METEVKFFLTDPETIKTRLLAAGLTSKGPVSETNIRFEDAGRSLLARRSLLRLRQDEKAVLTFKSEPAEPDPDFKTYRELEVRVDDFETTRQILTALGFEAVQTYEKYRQTFRSKTTVFCLDTMPFGVFLEIEGRKDRIQAWARQLGLPWETRILTNYLAIFEKIRQAHDLSFTDVTFDNFRTLTIDFAEDIQRLQSG